MTHRTLTTALLAATFAVGTAAIASAENKPDRAGILNPVIRADEDTIIATRYGNMNRNCGAYEIHRLNPDDGRLELNAYYEKRDCGGAQVAPKDFPLVFTLDEMGD